MDLHRQILDASRKLLLASGYERLSMRRIAREIGISATSIYLYFNNKDALFEALVDEGMDRLFETLSRARASAGDSIESFHRMCRAYVTFGLENPEYYELMFMLRSDAMSRFPAEKYRRARRNLDLMQEVIADASGVDKAQARIRATSTWMTLHGAVSLIVAQRLDVQIDREGMIECILARLDAEIRGAPDQQHQPHAAATTAGLHT